MSPWLFFLLEIIILRSHNVDRDTIMCVVCEFHNFLSLIIEWTGKVQHYPNWFCVTYGMIPELTLSYEFSHGCGSRIMMPYSTCDISKWLSYISQRKKILTKLSASSQIWTESYTDIRNSTKVLTWIYENI